MDNNAPPPDAPLSSAQPPDHAGFPATLAGNQTGISVAIDVVSYAVDVMQEDLRNRDPGRRVDVAFMIVGVPGDDLQNEDGGAARVYFLDEQGQWQWRQTLRAPNPGPGDRFGHAVAISGTRLVIGAPGEDSAATGTNGDGADDSAPDSGAAYVYRWSGLRWDFESYVKASNSGAGDRFGSAVCVVDMDLSRAAELGQSTHHVAVGAPGEASGSSDPSDDSLPGAGACYLYRFEQLGPASSITYLKAKTPGAGDEFGAAVAKSGDSTLIGAPGEDGSASGFDGIVDDLAPDAGAAYLFLGDSPGAITYVKATNPDANDRFGAAVSLHILGTGPRLLVGAPGEDGASSGIDGDAADNSLPDAGASYFYSWSFSDGSSVRTARYVKASNPGAFDAFGSSVAFARVLEGPAYEASAQLRETGSLIAVGAPEEGSGGVLLSNAQDDDTAPGAGAVYVYQTLSGLFDWTQVAYVKPPSSGASQSFGASTAMVTDLYEREFPWSFLAVGSPGFDAVTTTQEEDAGAADVFWIDYLLSGP